MDIVILSGAGLSAPSGIATFRSETGLWENHPVEMVATPQGFILNPALVHSFYNDRRREILDAEPNKAHFALAKLEQAENMDVVHITQNIDNLCERAGCSKMVHMHGEILKGRCTACCDIVMVAGDLTTETKCPSCGFSGPTGGLRPDIVWFGENPIGLPLIETVLEKCNLMIVIGTSGAVAPAAFFALEAKNNGAKTVLLNKDEPDNVHVFDEVILGDAEDIVPAYVNKLIEH